MSLFDEIRGACREVAEGAQLVRIDRARLRDYAISLTSAGVPRPALDPRPYLLGHGDQTLAFIVVLDTINFGSGWFPYLRKRPGMSGSLTIASALADAFRSGQDFSAHHLLQISPHDCALTFGQDSTAYPLGQLMEKFAQALNDLGVWSWTAMGAATRRWSKALTDARKLWWGSWRRCRSFKM